MSDQDNPTLEQCIEIWLRETYCGHSCKNTVIKIDGGLSFAAAWSITGWKHLYHREFTVNPADPEYFPKLKEYIDRQPLDRYSLRRR